MTSERSKRRDFLSLIFITKSISKKLLINIFPGIKKKAVPVIGASVKAGRPQGES